MLFPFIIIKPIVSRVSGKSTQACRRDTSKTDEPIAALVPGNSKRKTKRPSAERLLSQFGSLHLLIEEKGGKISGVMVEELTALQKEILSLLELPEKIYDLSFIVGKKELDVQK